MSVKTAMIGIGLYNVVYACIDWYKAVQSRIGLYRLV